MKTLTAFCDLMYCPISYDFSVFLVRAMMERDARKCDGLHVVLVPLETGLGGFARAWGEHTEADTLWRLWHILMPMIPLAKATVTLADSIARAKAIRGAAENEWWPDGRVHLSGPVVDAARAGVEIPRFRATDQARLYVDRWIGADSLATITLRQMKRSDVRNSNVEAWVEFSHTLAADGYRVEVIGDSDIELGNGKGYAALDPDLRLALYERAEINFIGQNGPAVLCWFSNVRFMQFGFGLPRETWGRHVETNMALKHGQQLPWAKDQHLIWRPDTIEIIQEEYERWALVTP